MYHASVISTLLILLLTQSDAFTSPKISRSPFLPNAALDASSTSLNAIGVFARKAKEMAIKKYRDSGTVEESVLATLDRIESLSQEEETLTPRPDHLQKALTKRKGTITVIPEYKRVMEKGGFIDTMFEPEIVSPVFREFGAAAVAVMADERMGGCTYEDVKAVMEEQENSRGDMPGPLPVISSDLIVDEIQLALSVANGAEAVVLSLNVIGEERTGDLMRKARSVGLDVVVNVCSKEEAQAAVNLGGRILCVPGMAEVDESAAVVDGLDIPEGEQVCTIAVIVAKGDKGLGEIEEAWVLRDKGFNAVWVNECLFKSGNDPTEHAGAIIRSMGAKSSVKWASAKARGGKGEGAKEWLGDIMM